MNFDDRLADSSTFMAAVPNIAAVFSQRKAQQGAVGPSKVAEEVVGRKLSLFSVNEENDERIPERPKRLERSAANKIGHDEESLEEGEIRSGAEQTLDKKEDKTNRPIQIFTASSGAFGNKPADLCKQKLESGFSSILPQPHSSYSLIDFTPSEKSTPTKAENAARPGLKRGPDESMLDNNADGKKLCGEGNFEWALEAKLRESYVALTKELGEINGLLEDPACVMTPALGYLQTRKAQLGEKIAELESELETLLAQKADSLSSQISNLALDAEDKPEDVVPRVSTPEAHRDIIGEHLLPGRRSTRESSQENISRGIDTISPGPADKPAVLRHSESGNEQSSQRMQSRRESVFSHDNSEVDSQGTNSFRHDLIGEHILPGRSMSKKASPVLSQDVPMHETKPAPKISAVAIEQTIPKFSATSTFPINATTPQYAGLSSHKPTEFATAQSVQTASPLSNKPQTPENQKPNIPISAATLQYSGAAFQPHATPSANPTQKGPKSPVKAALTEARTTPFFPISAATLQYSGAFGRDQKNCEATRATPPPKPATNKENVPFKSVGFGGGVETSKWASRSPEAKQETPRCQSPKKTFSNPTSAFATALERHVIQSNNLKQLTTTSGGSTESPKAQKKHGLEASKWAD